MGKYTDYANSLKGQINRAAESLDDATASQCVDFYPALTYNGALVPYKTRIRWTDGCLYVAQYDTYDRVEYDPAHDTNGWARLDYRDGIRVIRDGMTTATMFTKDELGWWGDVLYRSVIANNSWTPDAYPAGWEAVT